MKTYIDRILLFLGCIFLFIQKDVTQYKIFIILTVIIIHTLSLYFGKSIWQMGFSGIYIILCIYYSEFFYFFPFVLYDCFYYQQNSILLCYGGIGSYIIVFWDKEWYINFTLIIYLFMAYHFARTSRLLEIKEMEIKRVRDTSKEFLLLLESQNKQLIEKQNYEIYLATLKERNRIAREIHDNVGHMLSRAILMVGAILAINRQEEIKESVIQLKDTLSEAMDSIRNSVHDLHNEAFDLQEEIKKVIQTFLFCRVEFDYDIEDDIKRDLKYSFIAIIKEALSNIIKHSNATLVKIIIREQPGFYQLVIEDNGINNKKVKDKELKKEGIGLENMKDRVAAEKGRIYITHEKGFRIFISIPKKQEEIEK